MNSAYKERCTSTGKFLFLPFFELAQQRRNNKMAAEKPTLLRTPVILVSNTSFLPRKERVLIKSNTSFLPGKERVKSNISFLPGKERVKSIPVFSWEGKD